MNEKIAKINETLEQFFNDPSNPKQILAKDLMPLLVKNGIFPSDHRKGPVSYTHLEESGSVLTA